MASGISPTLSAWRPSVEATCRPKVLCGLYTKKKRSLVEGLRFESTEFGVEETETILMTKMLRCKILKATNGKKFKNKFFN